MVRGNERYVKYIDEEGRITVFNLAEIYFTALNQIGQSRADEIYDEYTGNVVEVPDEILKEAMKFRYLNKRRNLSYADCIGYIYALKNNLKFLTGDKEFENLPNVEFVK